MFCFLFLYFITYFVITVICINFYFLINELFFYPYTILLDI